MMVDLSTSELELLDTALKAWQEEPENDGFSSMMMGALLGDREGREEKLKLERAKVDLEILKRERRALLLRAKLVQATSKESEHDLSK